MCADTIASFQFPGYPFSFDGGEFVILTVKSVKSFFSVVSYSSGFSKLFLKWGCWEASPSCIFAMSLENSGSLGMFSFGDCSSFSVLVLPLVPKPLGASHLSLPRSHGTSPCSSWNIRSGFGNGMPPRKLCLHNSPASPPVQGPLCRVGSGPLIPQRPLILL